MDKKGKTVLFASILLIIIIIIAVFISITVYQDTDDILLTVSKTSAGTHSVDLTVSGIRPNGTDSVSLDDVVAWLYYNESQTMIKLNEVSHFKDDYVNFTYIDINDSQTIDVGDVFSIEYLKAGELGVDIVKEDIAILTFIEYYSTTP